MLHLSISLVLLLLAILPLGLLWANLNHFHKTSLAETVSDQGNLISVLIPARNEENSIGKALQSILAQTYLSLEILVLDDHSDDDTAKIVADYSHKNSNVRLITSQPLPDGWNGKQFACWQLASQATGDFFLFLDADVRLDRQAIQQVWSSYQPQGVGLYSGFPNQETESFAGSDVDSAHVSLLLGYLPLQRSRADQSPAMAAGCGQLFFTDRKSYFDTNGHAAIRSSRHDGLMLPRSYRNQGKHTDLFDASDIATCRMYHNAQEVTVGLLKNATEGIANPPLIFVFTVLLLGGFVLPLLMFLHSLYWHWSPTSIVLLAIAALISFIPRILVARRWESSYIGALLNPISVAWFVALQWWAYLSSLLGKSVAWRGRSS